MRKYNTKAQNTSRRRRQKFAPFDIKTVDLSQYSPSRKQQILLMHKAYIGTKISCMLGILAIISFLIFGSYGAYVNFNQHLAYIGVHYLPYVWICLSIPLSLYHAFLCWRYKMVAARQILLMMALAVGLFLVSPFMAMVVWFCMPYLFRVNFLRFLYFLIQDGV